MNALRLAAAASLLGLIALTLAWELWLAPLRGVLHGRRYVYQWASLLILAYFAEGIVRAASDPGLSRLLAAAEVALSALFFLCAIFYARLGARPSD